MTDPEKAKRYDALLHTARSYIQTFAGSSNVSRWIWGIVHRNFEILRDAGEEIICPCDNCVFERADADKCAEVGACNERMYQVGDTAYPRGARGLE